MTGVVEMHLCARNQPLEIVHALQREIWVVPAPDDEEWRLCRFQKLTPLRIESDVGLVVVEILELDVDIARPVEARLIDGPSIWR